MEDVTIGINAAAAVLQAAAGAFGLWVVMAQIIERRARAKMRRAVTNPEPGETSID